MEMTGKLYTLPALSTKKRTRYTLNRRLGKSQSWEFVSDPLLLLVPGFEPRTVQPVLYGRLTEAKTKNQFKRQVTALHMNDRTKYLTQVNAMREQRACSFRLDVINAIKKKKETFHSHRFAMSCETERELNKVNTFLACSQGLFGHFTQMTSCLENPRNEHELHGLCSHY